MQNIMDLLNSIKVLIIGTLASSGVIIGSIASTSAIPVQVSGGSALNAETLKITQIKEESIFNREDYIYAEGTYSYLGQKVEYLFLIPKKGGSFSGSIKGACQAQVGGEYISSNGEIKGKAGGECKLFFMSYKGSTDFKGRLYPESKTLEIEIPNSPIKGPIKLNYN